MKWSEEAWIAAAEVFKQILQHPFVVALSDGTLSRERFLYYLAQDAKYLENYSRVLAHVASRLEVRDEIESFLKFALDGVAVERALHGSFLSGCNLNGLKASPSCLLYISFLKSQSYEPVEVEVASLLPCFWIYQKVGEHIAATSRQDNPYERWIETYADDTFRMATQRAIDLCDDMAERVTTETRQKMVDIFVICARMEWMFWDSAWKLEKWKI